MIQLCLECTKKCYFNVYIQNFPGEHAPGPPSWAWLCHAATLPPRSTSGHDPDASRKFNLNCSKHRDASRRFNLNCSKHRDASRRFNLNCSKHSLGKCFRYRPNPSLQNPWTHPCCWCRVIGIHLAITWQHLRLYKKVAPWILIVLSELWDHGLHGSLESHTVEWTHLRQYQAFLCKMWPCHSSNKAQKLQQPSVLGGSP